MDAKTRWAEPLLQIRNEPCDCPPGQCIAFVDPDTDCINRRAGTVVTAVCLCTVGYTWHQDGRCLRCGMQEDG
jgi:hypothetical protein